MLLKITAKSNEQFQTSNTEMIDCIEKENNRILQDGYITELSSFDYLPPKFLGINTKLFGQSVLPHDCEIHPFFKLIQM